MAHDWRMASASRWWTVLFVVLIVFARVIRVLFPQIWIEDESYLNLSLLSSWGKAPYTDFPLPHPPLLELSMGQLFRFFGATIHTAELITASAVVVSAVLIARLGARIAGLSVGLLAGVLYSFSPLLWRYHVMEREPFVVLFVVGAVHLLLESEQRRLNWLRVLGAALLLAVAMAIKLTAASAVLGGAAFFVWRRQWLRGLMLCALTLSLFALLVAVLIRANWLDAVASMFVFRLLHPADSWQNRIQNFSEVFSIVVYLGTLGTLFILVKKRGGLWALPLSVLGGCVAVMIANPTFWLHNAIELLPWLSLAAAELCVSLAERVPKIGIVHVLGPLTSAIGIALLATWIVVAVRMPPQSWRFGRHGFGFRDRAELNEVARFVRSVTDRDDLVHAPSIVAFVANRASLTPYPELGGTLQGIVDSVRRVGVVSTLRLSPLDPELFWGVVFGYNKGQLMPKILDAIEHKRARAVVCRTDDELFPMGIVDLDQATLVESGYRNAFHSAHYDVWVPN